MLKIFEYDNVNRKVCVAKHEVLLIQEIKSLFEPKRNICKEDKTGKQGLRAFRELTYIFFAIAWDSPYADYSEQERHQEALKDSEITEEEFNDPIFRAACRKFRELQESALSVRLLQAAKATVHRFIDYFNEVDPSERDDNTGKPIFKVKDIMSEVSNLYNVVEELKRLEGFVIKETMEDSVIRGGAKEGFEFTGDGRS